MGCDGLGVESIVLECLSGRAIGRWLDVESKACVQMTKCKRMNGVMCVVIYSRDVGYNMTGI